MITNEYLSASGFVMCDIPSCNCGQLHKRIDDNQQKIQKLKNGSETAIWAANEIEYLQLEITKLRGLAFWGLYHHQGANSEVGLPIRKSLGIGRYEAMTIEQIKEAKIAGGVVPN